jgi:hypothetical protein
MTREIDDLDFNTLRNKIIEVVGTGTASFGYGQDIKSVAVSAPEIITKAQWDGLRFDLVNILIHQNGVTPSLIEVARGDVVGEDAGDPLRSYDRAVDTARSNRFLLAAGQSTVTAVSTKTFSSAWSSSASMTAQLNFGSSDAARYFFNSGGKIRFSSSRSGGAATSQNNAWTNILGTSGTVEFGASTTNLGFYTLRNFYQTSYEATLSTPYSANVYRIEALCNVADNSAGTATSVTFRISWLDNYTDTAPAFPPPDQVDGTLTLSIEEIKAAGSLQPSGSFTITSPSYTVSNISAS